MRMSSYKVIKNLINKIKIDKDSLIYEVRAMRCSVNLIIYNNGAKYRDQKLLGRNIPVLIAYYIQ